MDLQEFKNKTLKSKGGHKSLVNNSNGTKEAWRWIKKNKWLNIGQPITENQFGKIVKAINSTLQDQLIKGRDIQLLHRMGRLELRKFNSNIKFENNKLITNLPVDWKKTLELWWEDEEAKKNKTLIRFEGKEMFTVYYNKKYANFNNKSFYQFTPTRALKRRLKDKILNGECDALLLAKNNEIY